MATAACRKAVSYTLLGPPAESLRAAAARAAEAAAKAAAAVPTTGDAFLDMMDLQQAGTAEEGVHGEQLAALWMHGCHPATLALNAGPVAEFGYLKDLPEILHRIIIGGVSTRTPGKKARLAALPPWEASRRFVHNRRARAPRRKGNAPRCAETREARIAAANERDRKTSADAAVERRRKRAEAAARAVDRYARDTNYRLLHDCTADLFAKLLAEDMQKLADGKVNELSLAAKWCPSLGSCYDRSTLMCEAIARRLFPKGSAPDLPEDLEDEYYAYRVRDRLQKAVAPLRRALEVPEIFVSAKAWGDVVYKRVASVATKNYKDLFLKHDAERFKLYLADVEAGKAKIAAGGLLPHEILASIGTDGVANLQWQRMIADLRALGKLSNSIAVCDVSGSVEGLPMDVCVALGLLISELSDDPWHHRVARILSYTAVFDKLLHIAVSGNLPPEKMVRRVFVFSDMEFDEASLKPWETDYEAIKRKFTEAGYGAAVPEIVFWNLRDSVSLPVTAFQKGVALVSGFSKNMVKLFDGIVTPSDIMDKVISGPEYQKLVVFD
uniref:Uncharacterized protein n=1 Tax=Setaria viridis TaxID=4556 RepID=A0A4U6UZB1_SETVI|nr:LOW QUALITY PROTEIN: hypothetical protein SEVIR_4G204200v2 [Setaria viridis]